MRISTYALATNPKYANFAPFNWQGLAGSLGSKTSSALNAAKGALPTTATGYGKLGAGVGAGIGALNYLGSEDKSIGNLAGQVAGGAAVGGAAGYGGASLKNAYQARKAGQIGNQKLLTPVAAPVQTTVPNQPIQTNAPASPQTIDTTAITVPNASGKTQSGNSQPYPLNNPNTKGVGTEQISPTSQQQRRDVRLQKYPQGKRRSGNLPTEPAIDVNGKPFSRNTSPFANFKVRRYNGFVY